MKLHHYQEEAINDLRKALMAGHKRVACVQPTGTGKTILAAGITDMFLKCGTSGKILFLVNMVQLVNQTCDKFKQFAGIEAAIEAGNQTAHDSDKRVIISIVQSLHNRLDQYPPDAFSMIIVDEAHLSFCPTYEKVFDHFKSAAVIGLTATPYKDGKKIDSPKLKNSYNIAYEMHLTEALKEGYLSPLKIELVPLSIDISKVEKKSGKYDDGQLSETIEPYLEAIAQEVLKRAPGRKLIVFTPTIKLSLKVQEVFNAVGIKTGHIDGKMKASERQKIVKDFESGVIDCLCNSQVLTTGFDSPCIDAVISLRSSSFGSNIFKQMVGRGLRLFPGKKNCLLLDFLWKSAEGDRLDKPAYILTDNPKVADKMDEIGAAGDLLELTEKAKFEVSKDEKKLVEALQANMERQIKEGKEEITRELSDYIDTGRAAPATEPQMKLINQLRSDYELFNPQLSIGEASHLIGKLANQRRPTNKQKFFLRKRGIDTEGLNFFQARTEMVKILMMEKKNEAQ